MGKFENRNNRLMQKSESLPFLNNAKSMSEVEEIFQNYQGAANEIVQLAVRSEAIDQEKGDVLTHDIHSAANAGEVNEVIKLVLRILYRQAIDYSDILKKYNLVDAANHAELKTNISRGPEFTRVDQEMADRLDAVAQQEIGAGANGVPTSELYGAAGEEILNGLAAMEARKTMFPPKKDSA